MGGDRQPPTYAEAFAVQRFQSGLSAFTLLWNYRAVIARVLGAVLPDGLPPVVLFAVIFFWTPPHFWALAMKFRDDYAAAGVPMLPVVAPAAVVARKIVLYSYAMVAATLALAPYAGWL
jgi:UbiA prenyltransferase family